MNAPVLLNDWAGKEVIDVLTDFDGSRWNSYRESDAVPIAEKPEFAGAEILLASYGYENWSGDAFVLFRRDGKLFEVNGSHCSCYGLEGQWEPEETTVEALKSRLVNGSLGDADYAGNVFAGELTRLLASMEQAP